MSAEAPIDVRDMAIIHVSFRNAFTESATLVRANPTPSAERVAFLADHIDFGVSLLHEHHAGEDELLYPLLAQRVPDQMDMVNEIEAQHQTVSGAVEAVTEATAKWRRNPSADTGEALAASLDNLNTVLQPHLDDEEAKIVPLAAITLTQPEWDSLGDHAIKKIPRNKMPIAFGIIVEQLSESDAAYMLAKLPPPVRIFKSFLIERPWKKYAHTLRHGT